MEFTTGRAPAGGRTAQVGWGYGHYFLFAAIAAVGAGLALSVEWIIDPHHIALPEWGVAMVVGAAVATILLVMMSIESVTELGYQSRHVIVKIAGALWALVAAVLAPAITVAGSVLLIGLMLAGMVTYGVVLEHRLHVVAQAEPISGRESTRVPRSTFPRGSAPSGCRSARTEKARQ